MKKVLLSLLLVATGSAFAQSVTINAQQSDPEKTGPNSNQLQLSVKGPINKVFAVDGLISNQVTEDTYKQTTRYEIGGNAVAPIVGPVDGYGRVAVGQKNVSGTQGFGYYSTEAGVIYHTPLKGFDAAIGYRYRTAFAEGKGDTTNTTRYKIAYALTAKDSIGAGYDVVRGDGANRATSVSYTRKF